MTLEVDLRKRLAGSHSRSEPFQLDVAFQTTGRLTALVGPSGSGKTSLVNLIAGLSRPDEGRIAVNGTVLVDQADGTFLAPHRRHIGYVFQDARLFPHLTVRRNLLFGRWFSGKGFDRRDFDRTVDLLGIAPLLDRRPALLSGGEKQRVAIGRALLAAPRLILMDEPLAALDDARKAEILPTIERLRDVAQVPIVYVSHSLAEVARLASDIVVLDRGKVSAFGTAEMVLADHERLPPEDRDEQGTYLTLAIRAYDDAYGLAELDGFGGTWRLPRVGGAIGDHVRVRIRARDVVLSVARPEGLSALNVVRGEIEAIRSGEGPEALVTLREGQERLLARLTRYSAERLGLTVGKRVHAIVKTVAVEGSPLPSKAWPGDSAGS